MKAQEVANKLNEMELSVKAREVVEQTDMQGLVDLFGKCETAEDVEAVIDTGWRVTLPCGKVVDPEDIIGLMDEEILAEMESSQWYDYEQDWFNDYCTRHALKHKEVFELAKMNPVW